MGFINADVILKKIEDEINGFIKDMEDGDYLRGNVNFSVVIRDIIKAEAEKAGVEFIKKQDAIDAIAKQYRYESDRMTALQEVPVFKLEDKSLTDDEIECFNAYIEDAGVDIAFGNSDWCHVYYKIVDDKVSDYAKKKMDMYFE